MFRFLIDYLFPKNNRVIELEAMPWHEIETGLRPAPHVEQEGILAIFAYREKLMHDLLWEIKYHANKKLAKNIAPIIIDHIVALLHDDMMWAIDEKPVITFIPQSNVRKEKRGFDQGEIVLDALQEDDRQERFIYIHNLLAFSRDVTQQSKTKNRNERFANMHDAFVCKNEELVRGKTIIVLDDVCTTGATLLDARRALLYSGASRVHAIAIAH